MIEYLISVMYEIQNEPKCDNSVGDAVILNIAWQIINKLVRDKKIGQFKAYYQLCQDMNLDTFCKEIGYEQEI